MDSTNFCYWLQGALELARVDGLDYTQVQIIQDHLDLVFNKVTPSREVVKTNLEIIKQLGDNPPTPFTFPKPYIGDYPSLTQVTC